jgi:beta-lactamase class D
MSLGRTICFLALLTLCTCQKRTTFEVRDDLGKFYSLNQLEGSFVLYDLKKDKYIFCHKDQADQAYTPASTFKIFISLASFESGLVNYDDNPTGDNLKPNWQSDWNGKKGNQSSSVDYYRDIVKKVGAEKMKLWMDQAGYGNADTTGGVDQFWQTGKLHISPVQQVAFIRKLCENKLPFSPRNCDMVKKLMLIKDSGSYKVLGKTGWGEQDNQDIGWFVGYVETADDTYIFANCIQSSDPDNPYFETARTDIAYKILDELKIIPR